MTIKIDSFELAPLYNARKSGLFETLEEEGGSCLLFSKELEIAMAAGSDWQRISRWIQKHDPNGQFALLAVHSAGLADAVEKLYPNKKRLDCYEAVWTKPTPPEFASDPAFQIRPASLEDVSWISSRYDLESEENLRLAVKDGDLFVAEENGKVCGFGGFHGEKSMGILEILPDFRRKGYGLRLEAFLIAESLKRGLIPYADIFSWNQQSLAMQKKLGLQIMNERFCWFVPEDD